MTATDRSEHDPGEPSSIVISGLDGPEYADGEANISPTDEAVQRLQSQRERGEPEDEDG
ncbi:hypothetical protein [Deinococcus aquiradiocola]|uniref:Uncharacterized protein n=1 Tax=Deinococcus aquiradiocola TaxID=393059 RepID=A0A917PIW2_9DEIO|nr:hypothetical protein [Deinococcus aquiradiocola]GGJ81194.1 hypothetical protein GCM10008939_26530 [Deinococcus aquiradiocola]